MLLIIYALQIQRWNSSQILTIWIDNAAVLNRVERPIVGDNLKDHMVLDYNLWRTMMGILDLIYVPLMWEKVNSHIEGIVYKYGAEPKGEQHSIILNMAVAE